MPVKGEKFAKGIPVYLISASDRLHRRGWRTIEQAGEEVTYSIFSHGVTYNELRKACLDIVNCIDIEDIPVNAMYERMEVKNIILVSEYIELKKNSFKEPGEAIEEGAIVTLKNSGGGRVVYAKVMTVEKSVFGDQYEIVTTGDNVAHTVRRGDLGLPKEVYNVRDVTIRKQIMEYHEGSEAQIVGGFLYIGGDDILVNEKYAANKKMI